MLRAADIGLNYMLNDIRKKRKGVSRYQGQMKRKLFIDLIGCDKVSCILLKDLNEKGLLADGSICGLRIWNRKHIQLKSRGNDDSEKEAFEKLSCRYLENVPAGQRDEIRKKIHFLSFEEIGELKRIAEYTVQYPHPHNVLILSADYNLDELFCCFDKLYAGRDGMTKHKYLSLSYRRYLQGFFVSETEKKLLQKDDFYLYERRLGELERARMRLREQLQRTEAFCCYDERQMNEFCNSIYYTYNLTKVLKNYRGWIINRIHETDVTNYILKKELLHLEQGHLLSPGKDTGKELFRIVQILLHVGAANEQSRYSTGKNQDFLQHIIEEIIAEDNRSDILSE